jgi:phosphatidylglycerol:prolipoprotein diacylglycerol transferase
MQPEIEIIGISVKTFGVVFALAFLACGALIARRLKELDKPVDWAYEIVFSALLGGVIGARAYFVIQNYSEVKHDLLKSLFSGSGLVWYGGAIGGAIGVLRRMNSTRKRSSPLSTRYSANTTPGRTLSRKFQSR